MLVNGVDLIQWDAAGKITEFKVMIRPLKAINLIHERMAPCSRHYMPDRRNNKASTHEGCEPENGCWSHSPGRF